MSWQLAERAVTALERIADALEAKQGTPTPKEGQLLTTEQVADRLQVSADKVLELRARGDLHAVKVGVGWRFPLGSVETFVEKRMSGPVGVVRDLYSVRVPPRKGA